MTLKLAGERFEIRRGDELYPEKLNDLGETAPERLYGIGNPEALSMPSVAVIGARRSIPESEECADRFARLAAESGACVVSGGARGIDSQAHQSALDACGCTVAVLGGGVDMPYPAENRPLFEHIAVNGGAVVSEFAWGEKPMPYRFRQRNRIIAALGSCLLVVQCALPSGTFSTADDAMGLGRPVLAVPGSITGTSFTGSNQLLVLGAKPIVDDATFLDALRDAGAAPGCDRPRFGI